MCKVQFGDHLSTYLLVSFVLVIITEDRRPLYYTQCGGLTIDPTVKYSCEMFNFLLSRIHQAEGCRFPLPFEGMIMIMIIFICTQKEMPVRAERPRFHARSLQHQKEKKKNKGKEGRLGNPYCESWPTPRKPQN